MISCELSAAQSRRNQRGHRIRKWREAQSPAWSQDRLADELGISTSALRAWESGAVVHIIKGKERLLAIMDKTEEWLEFGPVKDRVESKVVHSPPPVDSIERSEPTSKPNPILDAEPLILLGQYGPELSAEALKSISTFIKYLHHREAEHGHENPPNQ